MTQAGDISGSRFATASSSHSGSRGSNSESSVMTSEESMRGAELYMRRVCATARCSQHGMSVAPRRPPGSPPANALDEEARTRVVQRLELERERRLRHQRT